MTGIAVTKLVITVAPQKLIWPQGRTYPMNAVKINNKKITQPETQVANFLPKNDLK